jgi:hypothetical protein
MDLILTHINQFQISSWLESNALEGWMTCCHRSFIRKKKENKKIGNRKEEERNIYMI